jgi:hypothetical protein
VLALTAPAPQSTAIVNAATLFLINSSRPVILPCTHSDAKSLILPKKLRHPYRAWRRAVSPVALIGHFFPPTTYTLN